MTLSPTAAIEALFPNDSDFDHPPGFYLTRVLSERLEAAFGIKTEFENWRDAGWATTLELEGSDFEVFFAGGTEPDAARWMLGVSELGQPGFVARLFGAKVEIDLEAIRRLVEEIHAVLASNQHVTKVRWALNEDPSSSEIEHPGKLDWPGEGAT